MRSDRNGSSRGFAEILFWFRAAGSGSAPSSRGRALQRTTYLRTYVRTHVRTYVRTFLYVRAYVRTRLTAVSI